MVQQIKMDPIETAPKDGRTLLLWGFYSYTVGSVSCGFVESSWDSDDNDWTTPLGTGYGEFTHWAEIAPLKELLAKIDNKAGQEQWMRMYKALQK